jgi:hypothetical protein
MQAGLFSWRGSVTLAVCVTVYASAPGCVALTDDTRPPEQTTIAPATSQKSIPASLDTPSVAPDSVTSIEVPGRSFLATSADDPSWQSLVADRMARPCASHVTTRQADDDTDECGKEALVAQTAFFLRDGVTLRPPSRHLWLYHPRLIPLTGGESSVRMPASELAHEDDVGHLRFRNPYTGLRDQPLLHRDTERGRDSNVPDIGPPPPKHTFKTFAGLTAMSLIGIGVYALGPSSFTGASKEGEDVWGEARDHFKEAWKKPPVFDKDRAVVNYLGHPFFGAQFYLSQRNYGESPLYSFLFSTFTSTCFEYFIESWSERPSITDLIVTPIVGSILGEVVYQATRHMRKDGFTTGEKIILTVINPLYVMQNGYH